MEASVPSTEIKGNSKSDMLDVEPILLPFLKLFLLSFEIIML